MSFLALLAALNFHNVLGFVYLLFVIFVYNKSVTLTMPICSTSTVFLSLEAYPPHPFAPSSFYFVYPVFHVIPHRLGVTAQA